MSPVDYTVHVFYENKVALFSGNYSGEALPSKECHPTNRQSTKLGFFVGSFVCQCCGADYMTDRNNCGGCGKACSSTQICESGKCTGKGEIEVSLSWDRLGALNLYVSEINQKTSD